MTTKLLPKTGCYSFLAEPFHCDFSAHLFIGHLGNHLLNAADFHSDERGYGMSYLLGIHKTWVLSRLVIEMQEMPKAYDPFEVETWVDGVMKFFTTRNFAILNSSKQPLGYAKSVWALIDTRTRKPSDILAINPETISHYTETEKECPIERPSHVKMGKDAQLMASIATHYSDVDMNGHVNSIKYIEHALNLKDLEFYRSHTVQRIEVAYIAESYCGDRLNFYVEECGNEAFNVRITRMPPEGIGESDACRIKVLFHTL